MQTPILFPGSLPPTNLATALWKTLLSLNTPQLDSVCPVAKACLGHVMGQVLFWRLWAQKSPCPGVSLLL